MSKKIEKNMNVSFYRAFGCFSAMAMGVQKHNKKHFKKKSCRKGFYKKSGEKQKPYFPRFASLRFSKTPLKKYRENTFDPGSFLASDPPRGGLIFNRAPALLRRTLCLFRAPRPKPPRGSLVFVLPAFCALAQYRVPALQRATAGADCTADGATRSRPATPKKKTQKFNVTFLF
jgi:hypothetical protein